MANIRFGTCFRKKDPRNTLKKEYSGDPFFLWEILLKVSAEKKDPSGRITLRGKNCAICDSYDGAVYDRKKWNVKWKNFYFT